MSIQTIVFDAYGTLFDVYAVTARLEKYCPGLGAAIAQLWRDKQIEYSRLVSLSDPSPEGSHHYESFLTLTLKALTYATARHSVQLTDAQTNELMLQYEQLDAFAECHAVLQELKGKGFKTAILSNGSEQMLSRAVDHAALTDLLDHVISVDSVRHFKTMPQTYSLVKQTTQTDGDHVLFVSGNGWDVLGAQWFGFRTCWINRLGMPTETLGPPPHYQGRDLNAVFEALK